MRWGGKRRAGKSNERCVDLAIEVVERAFAITPALLSTSPFEVAGHAFALTPALSRKREREFQRWRVTSQRAQT